jgi:hypothetical protein
MSDIQCGGQFAEVVDHKFTCNYTIGGEGHELTVEGKRWTIFCDSYYTGKEWDIQMNMEYKGVTGYAYSYGKEMEDFLPREQDNSTKNFLEVLKMVADDLGLDAGADMETWKSLMELFWGGGILNHELCIDESSSRKRYPKMWEFALSIMNES